MITVAIVEDDAGIRRSLEWLLKSSPEFLCVAACKNYEEALRLIPKAAPQVILMDINLPDRSGIECTARIKEALPETQVVMITVYGDTEKVYNALRAGASGYILKRTPPARILQAIREVHAGGVAMSGEIARKVLGAFREPTPAPTEELNLSRREQEVLELLSQGCANKEIGVTLGIREITVKVHRGRVMQKMQATSVPHLVTLAARLQLPLVPRTPVHGDAAR